MIGDIGRWNYGLLFAAVIIVLGIVGMVSRPSDKNRSMFQGLILQGVLLICVVGTAYREHGSDLKLAAFLIAGLLIIQHVMLPVSTEDDVKFDEDQPA